MKNERRNHCFCSWNMQICDALYTRMAGMTTIATTKYHRDNENDEYWIFIDCQLNFRCLVDRLSKWMLQKEGMMKLLRQVWWMMCFSLYRRLSGNALQNFLSKQCFTESFTLILTHGWEHFLPLLFLGFAFVCGVICGWVLLLLHSDLKDFSAGTLLSLLSCGGSVAWRD